LPFVTPVPAKFEGKTLETIAKNHWSVGIRDLSQEIFSKILKLAGTAYTADDASINFPDLALVRIEETDEPLLVPHRLAGGENRPGYPHARYATNATPIGNRAEEIVHKFLIDRADTLGAKNIRWISRDGLKPGWDLQYEDQAGEVVAIEVKGTAAAIFASIDLTAGEWRAASSLGDQFWLYLVACCCGIEPIIQRIRNPAILLESGLAALTPVVYRFSLTVQEVSDRSPTGELP